MLIENHDSNSEIFKLLKEERERQHPDFEIRIDYEKNEAGDDWRKSLYNGMR